MPMGRGGGVNNMPVKVPPPPLPLGTLYSPWFCLHQDTGLWKSMTKIYNLKEKIGAVKSLIISKKLHCKSRRVHY